MVEVASGKQRRIFRGFLGQGNSQTLSGDRAWECLPSVCQKFDSSGELSIAGESDPSWLTADGNSGN
ncbi:MULTISPECIES: hypothetical protein [Planktothricoides]|uniref:Transposase n=2 Tax=Planktothricoides raciborskii TaxID=132608 RepID=A0AAU8JK36_9CYAN|nr:MULTISPECIES: hypothetical protein [Planktothricoides]MBD2542515.1 hypothetical protein [Planktothricoides raciborskii FACHB-1370]MBD2580972.1 hypothetical protein [Planktothricoides raciborskii FACHB-1261]